MKTYLQKRGVAFVPADAEEEEKIRSMPSGEIYRAELKRPRNYGNHRHMFRLLKYVLNNSDKFRSMDQLLIDLKIRCGHYDEYITKDGELIYIPRSINFDSMPEDDFKEFKQKAIDVILDEFLPGVRPEDRDAHFMNLWGMVS